MRNRHAGTVHAAPEPNQEISAVAPRTRSDAGRRTRLARYLVAVGSVTLVTLLRVPLGSLLGNTVPFILYFPAIMIAGWYGGFGPGMAATLLSGYCAKTWFFEPVGTFSIDDWGSAFRLLVFLANGALISYLCGRLHDRTGQVQHEKAHLEETVRERTANLQIALSDMEAFSYTVSHDLRSPMRSMHGFSELLLEKYSDVIDPEGQEYLHRIRKAALRLDHLISDLLAFAKLSGSNVELQSVPLRAAVARVVETSPRWSTTEVKLSYEGCVHSVRANETLLNQILQNLMENAAKFVAPGVTPEIRVWTEQRGNVVRLWVGDNGIGIAPENRARLFQLFERVETQRYTGTGIGLAIVDRAVMKMNGRVGVESQPGHGSSFWVELEKA